MGLLEKINQLEAENKDLASKVNSKESNEFKKQITKVVYKSDTHSDDSDRNANLTTSMN